MSIKYHKLSSKLAFNDFKIIAIHANIPAYRLAWCLDDTFSTQFVCEPESFTINLLPERNSNHVEYHFNGSDTQSRLWLIQNNGTAGRLYSGKPTPDYWLIVEDVSFFDNFNHFIDQINGLDLVQMAYLFPELKAKKLTWTSHLSHLVLSKENDDSDQLNDFPQDY